MYPIIRRPIIITTANRGIRVIEGATQATRNIAEGTYWLRGDGSPNCLLTRIQTALNTGSPNTYTVNLSLYSVTPGDVTAAIVITRTVGTATFGLLWANALTTFDESLIGFPNTDTANDAAAKASTLSPSALWVGDGTLALDQPSPLRRVFGGEPSNGGRIYAGALSVELKRRVWRIDKATRTRVLEEAVPSDPNASYERMWRRISGGELVELGTLDAISFAATPIAGQWIAGEETRQAAAFDSWRESSAIPLYSWEMRWHQQVTP
jgi:hypothetical protein